MTQSIDQNRIIWHSRRGMLELDLLLEPFARECFGSLSADRQGLYQKLLACEDQDLYAWLMQRRKPADSSLEPIIDLILAKAKSAG